ncbi:unnamed protein product [Rhizoctonia solani]|uniref:CSD domain-containing protein n=3 Tax=Rhizoctonia solani TaxID=456999 RepID=A0A8H3AJJ4_9AGAM|nr:cold-shock DNA-binding domain protein [Rhizoctonia solani AG-3 Rhs1AP]KEP45544.1 cold-shock DNA-binding domain protein [Rhizoctonia solani 123E]CAE6424968.1 unnamed protein product [Rhizoctonia solani]CAE6440752.1 unnamed protein product [Rhizoctonia solani]
MAPNTGVVKWFNEIQGHGFISRDDNGPDLFVRHTNVNVPGGHLGRGVLREGDMVSFNVTQTPRGPAAVSVTVREVH